MSELAIRITGLGKQYTLGQGLQDGDNFRELLADGLTSLVDSLSRWRNGAPPPSAPMRKRELKDGDAQKIWALRNLSFEVKRGEVVGVIGRNGAGKSTLLKLLSRITEPTEGRIELRGRTASLLEVGTGFHPELTGRENIYLNGAILGMSRQEVARSFDRIVDFAEVERFIDTPVKRYSSGMYTRLAFAVAAHLQTDILIVDEVLAVGDVAFQAKCLGAMENLAGSGRTILFVSHNMSAVERLCSRAVVLENGGLRFNGDKSSAISDFLSSVASVTEAVPLSGPLQRSLAIRDLRVNDFSSSDRAALDPSEEICLTATLEVKLPIERAKVVLSIRKGDVKVVEIHDVEEGADLPAGTVKVRASLPAHFLSPGDYSVGLGCFSAGSNAWTIARGIARFAVMPISSGSYDIGNMGLVHLVGRGSREIEMGQP